jgi:hypothetical protein
LLDDGDWLALPLTPEQTRRKYEAIVQNRTELTTAAYYLISFARANELFATIGVLPIPVVPADMVINWKRAVRSKSIGLGSGDAPYRPDAERVFSEELSAMDLEETAFVRQGDDLIAQVTLRHRLGKRANVHLLLYGYQRGCDFAAMPKLHINVTPIGSVHVFDGGKRLKDPGVTVTGVDNRLIVRLPLRLLGETRPDQVFTATRANLGEVAADDSAWHLFSLSKDTETGHTIGDKPATSSGE